MPKFRKKPIVIEATQWFKNGDHLKVSYLATPENKTIEGRAYAAQLCEKCGKNKGEHGWIDTLEGGHIVCPGDYIITGIANENYPCKPKIFLATYEPVGE